MVTDCLKKSKYICNGLTDFDRIRHSDASWPSTLDRLLKLKHANMIDGRHIKNCKIATSLQSFELWRISSLRTQKYIQMFKNPIWHDPTETTVK